MSIVQAVGEWQQRLQLSILDLCTLACASCHGGRDEVNSYLIVPAAAKVSGRSC